MREGDSIPIRKKKENIRPFGAREWSSRAAVFLFLSRFFFSFFFAREGTSGVGFVSSFSFLLPLVFQTPKVQEKRKHFR
jgi:hypothetical protein